MARNFGLARIPHSAAMSLAAPNASGASVFRYLRFERNKRAVTDVMSITLRRRLPATTAAGWRKRRRSTREDYVATAVMKSQQRLQTHEGRSTVMPGLVPGIHVFLS
jgi:hypothetical protein